MNNFLLHTFRPDRNRWNAAKAVGTLAAPTGVRFIPGEQVLLLSVSLPKMPEAQRRRAVAFAVEDRIARPIDEVCVTLGPQLGPDRWLVGVVARSALPQDTKARVLPDTLALPVPPAGHWAVWQEAGRVLIRLPDGTALVARPDAVGVLHQMAGAPAVTLYAGDIAVAHSRAPLPQVTLPARFDLSDPRREGRKVPRLVRRLAAMAVVAALGHLAILIADTVDLRARQAALASDLRAAAGVPDSTRVADLLARILAPPPARAEAGFLPLLSATFAAMAPQAGRVAVREMRYLADQNSLILTLQSDGLGNLQQIETDLAAAGAQVSPGPATSGNGIAEQQLTVQGPPG